MPASPSASRLSFGTSIEDSQIDFASIAAQATIGLTIAFPVLNLLRTAALLEFSERLLPASIAVTLSLPLQLRLIVSGLRNEKPPHAELTLVALAAVHVAAAMVIGPAWVTGFAQLVVAVLIVVTGFAGLLLAAGTVALAGLFAASSIELTVPFVVLSVVWTSTTLIVLVRLVASIRQLEEARRELRDRAIVRERIRIGAELRGDLSHAIEAIAVTADRAAAAAKRQDAGAATELRGLVDASRAALAHARRLVSKYQDASVGGELTAARSLLDVAGVRARILVRDARALDAGDEASLVAVRGAVVGVLLDDSLRECVLEVSLDERGRVRVDISPATANDRPGRR